MKTIDKFKLNTLGSDIHIVTYDFNINSYVNNTNIVEVSKYKYFDQYDWRFARSWVKYLVYEKINNSWDNVNNLTEEEKRIAGEWLPNLVPLSIIQMFTQQEFYDICRNFHNQSVNNRTRRLREAETFMFTSFPLQQSLMLLDEITGYVSLGRTLNLSDRYINGIELQSTDGYYGLCDYVNSLAGRQDLTPINGMTMQQISDYVNNILLFGVV